MNRETFERIYFDAVDQAERDAQALIDDLPAVSPAIADSELADALRAKLVETQAEITRMRAIDDRPAATAPVESGAVDCLVGAVVEIASAPKRGAARDIALIAALQQIQHHQIATYGTLAAYAKTLGRQDDKRVFGAMLEEERAIDGDLSVIAAGLLEPLAELTPA